jgi:predicted ATPase/serine/threonine protein kinase/predicted transcriptional regulator
MPLASGEKLGPYEILSPLGVGGMGEVYRARDTRLGRTVAIKVLPEHLSQKSDLRQRLESEARAISRLSHPNICTLHDIGHQEGKDFLVLEFVEGTTLRQLLASSGLPLRKLIPIAVQIADGLAKAHEIGIVHRDLKPENLMVSADTVKILDFGLAKLAIGNEASSHNTSAVRSVDTFATSATGAYETQPGTILGTVGYMSPEQAGGRPLDFRSDQFSFGLVLYEMATGKRPFRRSTTAQTLAAIIDDEAEPIGSLNPEIPPPFCWVVERCLAKEPEKRYFSTRDLARDLVAIRDRLSDLQLKRPGARPSNLPVPGTAFVGRDKELAAAQALFLQPGVRLITVTGPGGIGKSRLALELAREMAGDFPSGVHFVPLSAVNDPSLITLVVAQTLGIRETGGQPPLDAVREYLGSLSAPMLLLIDNFEHLVGAAPMLAELLTLAPNLKLLVTSRAALHIYQEHEFPVPSLSLPDARSLPPLEALSRYSAISLFVQRAVAVKPDFKLTEENASAVAEICWRLDGLPLAIELAAARTKLLSPSAMRTRLASSLQLLTGGARDLPARQQTLRQAIDWSFDLLSEPEQKLFRRLSVFLGGCTLEAVESVCDTKQDLRLGVLDGMASMVDKSLVRQIEQADGEPRFVMLKTIREYGLEKLTASGEEPLVRRAHAAYSLVLAEEGAAEDVGANQTGWLDRFELEHDNFRGALEWLTATGNSEWGLRLAAGLFRFWEMREHLAEGRDRLGKILELDPAAFPNLRQRALFAAGVLAIGQGDYVASDTLFNQSLEIANRLADKRSVAVSFNALAVNARDRNDLPSSSALFEASLGLWRELKDRLAVARALSNLANIAKLQEDYPNARALYEECLAIFREVGDRTGVAWALNHQGDVARDQGDSVAARSLYDESLTNFRELNDRWGIAGCLADLGNLAREQKDYRAADSSYRESLRIFQELEHKRGVARLVESFACSVAAQSEAERALRLAGAAAALRQSIGAALTSAEQAKLERGLRSARQGLTTTTERTAWLEGWVMPVEKAVEDVLRTAAGAR